MEHFRGFSKKTFAFLAGIEKNNNKAWFDASRDIYDQEIVAPAKAFVTDIGEFFRLLSPGIRTAPKFNETLMRMNNDMRFSKGNPYRPYFLIHFGRFKLDSEFYIFLDKKGIDIGLFLNKSKGEEFYFRQNMETKREFMTEIFDRCGISGKFSLMKLDKMPEMMHQKFIPRKHYDDLLKLKFALIEKHYPLTSRITTSASLVTEAIKIFSRLYPIYCFSVSDKPEKLISDFENKLGIPE
ncbi:MAG: hypothetical protein FMNOHCHN_01494 [Ignavibacteriaceae bacterium]|nr:hypothetical protein [Ignavibacteriaceae bacterium]